MKRFIGRTELAEFFHGKTVAVVGSGPGVIYNEPGHVDSHDIVVRVNNYKTGERQGYRTDVHYSFYGSSIKKTEAELKSDGVRLCVCKCPDAKFMESDWHRRMNKPHGVDFRYIYQARESFWFCDTYVPDLGEFQASFDLLEQHIPSTGFSALLLIASLGPKSIYATGFDFFASGVHNVNERWRPGNPDDPIGHAPALELAWLRKHLDRIKPDPVLMSILEEV